jgi:Prokaryotic E2 family E
VSGHIEAIHDGIERLRTRWPQSHYSPGRYGQYAIFVPGMNLPKGYVVTGGHRATICTVLFLAPAGFPAAKPDHFFTDIELRLDGGAFPKGTLPTGSNNSPLRDWPQWEGNCQWWSWHLQMWDPNRSGLVTFIAAVRQRLNPAR